MYEIAQKEIDAVAKVIRSYHAGGECERFEKRYAKYLNAKNVGV